MDGLDPGVYVCVECVEEGGVGEELGREEGDRGTGV